MTDTATPRTGGKKDLAAALRGGTWALAGTVVGRLANTAVLLAAAAVLGGTEFGALSLAVSTALVVAALGTLGLPVAAQKLVAEAGEVDVARRERLVDVTALLALGAGTAAAGGFLAASGPMASTLLGDPALQAVLVAAAPLVLTTPAIEILAGLLAARERFRAVGVLRAAQGCVAAAAAGALLLSAPSAAHVLGALAVGEALTCVIGWTLLRRTRAQRVDRSARAELAFGPVARALLRVALPAMLAGLALQPALWLGQVVLSRQPDGLAAVGLFAVAMRWHAIALFVPATMGTVLLPMLGRLRATGHHDDARLLFLRYGGLTLVFSVAVALVLAAGSPLLMALQGPAYAAGGAVLAVLAAALVPTALNNVLGQRAVAEGRLTLWVISDVALAATLAGCALVLVPATGATGLATAYLAAYVVTCLVLLPVAFSAPTRGQAP